MGAQHADQARGAAPDQRTPQLLSQQQARQVHAGEPRLAGSGHPFALEALYIRLGQPAWFWPLVMVILLALMCLAGNNEGGAL